MLATFALAPEGRGGEAGVAPASAGSATVEFLELLVTAGRGGSTTFATSRGGSGASAGGWISVGIVFNRSPGLAGKIEGSLVEFLFLWYNLWFLVYMIIEWLNLVY